MQIVEPHAFKNRAATHDGKQVTILRLAHSADADAALEGPHFLVRTEDGEKAVVPVAAVLIAPAPLQFIEPERVEDKDAI